MALPWKTLRVFISSTFRDMQAERDHLVRFVFPRLREQLLKHRIHLIDVDLRWGVTSDQDAVGICREVIDECHPRFIGMLGGRYGWIPPGCDRSITADEVDYGVLEREAEQRGNAVFYFRDDQVTATIVEHRPGDFREPLESENAQKLANLKQTVVNADLPAFTYAAIWDDQQKRLTSLEPFGDHIFAYLLQNIQNDPELADRFMNIRNGVADEFVEERDSMETFIEARTERYVVGSRQGLLDEMTSFAISETQPNILVIEGTPGSGKSSLLGKFCRSLVIQQNGLVLSHFVGASIGSTDLRHTLRRLCHELASLVGQADAFPEDILDLIALFHKLLNEAGSRNRIVLVLDAVNQFDATDGAHDMAWLPREVPANIRIIISSLEHPALKSLQNRGEGIRIEKLPVLSVEDSHAIVDAFLQRYSKRFSVAQITALVTKAESGLPLYLLTALQELRTLGTYEEITDRVHELPGKTKELFGWILKHRLSNDPGFRNPEGSLCGTVLMTKLASCLGVSRHGLSQEELIGLIDPGDPLGNVAALLRLLSPYLMHRGELIDFFHGQLHEAVANEYLSPDGATTAHLDLANYFISSAQGNNSAREWETNNVRGFEESIFHLTMAGQYELAENLLSNFPFLLHKLRVGAFESVLDDYEIFRREAPGESVTRMEIWRTFFRERANILRRGKEAWPAHKIFMQLATEHANSSPLTQGAERWLAENRCDWFWLRKAKRPLSTQKTTCLSVFEGAGTKIKGSLPVAKERVLSWAGNTLRLWDLDSGACLAILKGHTQDIEGALVMDNGRLVSWSWDKTLRVWDSKNGACLSVLKGHTEHVSGALTMTDGKLISWATNWTDDEPLRVWDPGSGTCLAMLKGHAKPVQGAHDLGNGHILTWATTEAIRVWDVQTGGCRTLRRSSNFRCDGVEILPDARILSWGASSMQFWDDANSAGFRSVEIPRTSSYIDGVVSLPNGRIVSWSSGRRLLLWDDRSGECVSVLEHEKQVYGALPLTGGRLLSWSKDKSLRIWDSRTGERLGVLEGHTDDISGALELADGRVLSWSKDASLRLWDAQGGECQMILEGHSAGISGAHTLNGGRILSWSEDGTLRVWDSHAESVSGEIQAHKGKVQGTVPLSNGRHVSWAVDGKLRFWNHSSGECLNVIEAHTAEINHVLLLSDGTLLSASEDNTLRLWDAQSGACLSTFKGHIRGVLGALVLANGRFLSWGWDGTLRVWDCNGKCLRVLELNPQRTTTWSALQPVTDAWALVDGRLLSQALSQKQLHIWDSRSGDCLAEIAWDPTPESQLRVLDDGRVLSWSDDGMLRFWDNRSGELLKTLSGHSKTILGALPLPDGKLLSWSRDETFRLWDIQNNNCLEIVSEQEAMISRPEWLQARRRDLNPHNVTDDCFCEAADRSARLGHKDLSIILAEWNAESETSASSIHSDGTAVATQTNGQVCFLKLYNGNNRVTLAEAKALLHKLPIS